jgi:thiosulfate dehydrogenase
MKHEDEGGKNLLAVISKLLSLILFLLLVILGLFYVLLFGFPKPGIEQGESTKQIGTVTITSVVPGVLPLSWIAPDTTGLRANDQGRQILYGRSLIVNTAFYFGPQGTLAHLGNGMNCQNCHLDAGTKPYGNNYSAVASTYPKFRGRSGKIESMYKRINDCFERSLNGKGLDTLSKEMQAMKAYLNWLGKDVKKGEKPENSGIQDLAYLNRAADPEMGKTLFQTKCISCHGVDGLGKMNADGKTYLYPPLFGAHSFNTGAGLFRVSRFAGYIKNNMPQGATKGSPQLTDQEAWDIAAFVNSQDRPKGDASKDWPKIAAKPVDHPFGPYADKFSEKQHKYGPFGPIAEEKKKRTSEADRRSLEGKKKTT